MRKTPAWLTDTPVAHRGFHGEGVPENTIAAFTAAAQRGYAIECDVQLTLDEDMVVFHDTTLTRLADVPYKVHYSTYEQLRAHPLGGTQERMPNLRSLLKFANGQTPLLIEVKPGRRHKLRARLTAELLDGYRGPVALQSFDPRIVACLKRDTNFPVGQIMGHYRDPGTPRSLRAHLEDFWLQEVAVNPDFTAFDLKKLSPEVSDCIRAKMPLLTWTVKDELKLAQARALADNVIFEHVSP